jgi:hypothetical protein
MTPSELERDRHESRLKAQRDLHAALEHVVQKEIVKRIHGLQRFLRRLLTPPETLADQGTAALERLAENLEAELAARIGSKT